MSFVLETGIYISSRAVSSSQFATFACHKNTVFSIHMYIAFHKNHNTYDTYTRDVFMSAPTVDCSSLQKTTFNRLINA